MEEIEQLQTSDATQESSSETPQAETTSAGAGDKPASAENTSSDSEQRIPYSRFQEVINERNQFASKLQDFEKRFEEFSRQRQTPQQPAPTPQQNKLIERLKGIDPEFAAWAEQQENAKASVAQLTQELQQYRAAAEQQQAKTAIEQLHSQNKVPAELQAIYQSQLREMAVNNPRLGLKDLPDMYKQVHDGIQKFLDGYKRQAVSEYTKSKSKDAVPASPKGQAPKPAPKQQKFSGDREEALSEISKQALQNLRAQRNA